MGDLAAEIRRWWAGYHWPSDDSDRQLLAAGPAALELLLDVAEGKVTLDVDQTDTQLRDYGAWTVVAVATFARAEPARVLEMVRGRGWDARRIALYLGSVPDPRILPYLIELLGDREPLNRSAAVNYLALHRDPRATEAVARALRDRSSDVRYAAVEALGRMGDLAGIASLEEFAERVSSSKRHAWLGGVARESIQKIHAARTAGAR
jgi:HEAT repeat protein